MLDLSTLNEEQREAVLDFDHNLLVLSCAGSGKTRTITSKIAYAIECGIYSPYEICAVTFTNKAANEMRERVESLLPDIVIDSLTIRTFHSLGALLLRRFGGEIGIRKDFTIYDDDDSVQILKSAIEAHQDEINKIQIENPRYDYSSFEKKSVINKYYNLISKAKDLGINPNNKDDLFQVSKDPILPFVFNWYAEKLRETGNLDYADLIGESKRLLKESEEALEYCHNRYRLILVDEYQDSNTEQFNFLKLFKGEDAQLVVVGDDDQSIYSFRGAEIKNILSFSKDFDNVKEIRLEKNYRSTDEILSPAGILIKHNKDRHEKDIISATGRHGEKPTLTVFNDDREEARNIAEEIKKNGNYGSTAILYRINSLSQPFEGELTALSIPFKLIGARRFYDREEVKDSLSFLRLLINHSDIISFTRIINKPTRGIGEKKIQEILSFSSDIFESLKEFTKERNNKVEKSAGIFFDAWEKAEEDLDSNKYSLGDILMTAINDTGLAQYYLDEEKDKEKKKVKMGNINQLVSMLNEKEYNSYSISLDFNAKEKTKREELEEFLERVTLDNTVEEDAENAEKESVTLISIHSVKGLEFDNVYCIGLESSVIPGERSSSTLKSIEEERRLLYVAMTRARNHLHLSYSKRKMQWGQMKDTFPSSFLMEMPRSYFDFKDNQYKQNFNYSRNVLNRINTFRTIKSSEEKKDQIIRKPILNKKEEKNTNELKESVFKVGDEVKHSEDGNGKVISVEPYDGLFKITVLFEKGNTLKFIEGKNNKISKL